MPFRKGRMDYCRGRQHRDLVTRKIYRRETIIGELFKRALNTEVERRGGNVNADFNMVRVEMVN